MTVCFPHSILTRYLLRPVAILTAVTCLATLKATSVEAQTGAGTGNNATGNSLNTGTNAAAADAGNSLTNQNVFSSAGDSVGQIGNNDGRFATSRLSTQPTAGGNTNAVQNATNQFRNLQRLNQQFNRTNQNNNNRNTPGTRSIRPSLRLGFIPKPRPAEDLRSAVDKQVKALTSRFTRLASEQADFAAVRFDLGKRGEIILTGEVPTDDSSKLLTNILRMEPGISSVRNELKVTQAAASQ